MDAEEAFRLLGVDPTEDTKILQRAYREKAKELHPDKATSDDQQAYLTKRFMAVRDAYEFLRDGGAKLPAPQEVTPDPPTVRTYSRNFHKRPEDEEEFTLSQKLGLGFQVSNESLLLWGVLIPAGGIGVVLFLRFLAGRF